MVEASDLPQDTAGETWARAPVQQKESVTTVYSATTVGQFCIVSRQLKKRKPIHYIADSFIQASSHSYLFFYQIREYEITSAKFSI